jgi:hypothetical protein
MLASVLLTSINHAMTDDGNDSLSEAKKLLAISEAMEIISTLDPGCFVITGNIPLVAGIKQDLPTGGIRLLALDYNTGADGSTFGRSIKKTTKHKKDSTTINWTTATGTEIGEYIYDPDIDPYSFLVVPQLSITINVHGTYAKVPPAVTANDDTFPLADTYRTATIEFSLYRIFTRDDVGTDNYTRGQGHYQKGLQMLGLKTTVDDRKDQELDQ